MFFFMVLLLILLSFMKESRRWKDVAEPGETSALA
jgi:hypothetical protein